MTTTTKNLPATLAATERGVTLDIDRLRPGRYIWHRGAYRRVTAVNGRSVRMGRYVLHSRHASTVEAAPVGLVLREMRRR